jgi:hypothetical protein
VLAAPTCPAEVLTKAETHQSEVGLVRHSSLERRRIVFSHDLAKGQYSLKRSFCYQNGTAKPENRYYLQFF